MLPYLDLQAVNGLHADEIHEAVRRVTDSGWYLLGEEVKRFEQHYAQYIGSQECVGVANGLDALTLIYRAYIEMGLMREGDEVIVPANTYIASILAITENAHTVGHDCASLRPLRIHRQDRRHLPPPSVAAG